MISSLYKNLARKNKAPVSPSDLLSKAFALHWSESKGLVPVLGEDRRRGRPFHVLVLPEPRELAWPGQQAGKPERLFLFPDGNGRSGKGHQGGAKNVVDLAEHAMSTGVKFLYVPIHSNGNNEREPGYIQDLSRLFLELTVRVKRRNKLQNIRCEVDGSLPALLNDPRGDHCRVELAVSVQALCSATEHVQSPKMTLVLGFLYGENAAKENLVQGILRPGMEEAGTLRLSGVASGGIPCWSSTQLFPEMSVAEFDDARGELAKQARVLPDSFDWAELRGFLSARLRRSTLKGLGRRPIVLMAPVAHPSIPPGAFLMLPSCTQGRVHWAIFDPSNCPSFEPDVVLASNQSGQLFHVPPSNLGYATVVGVAGGRAAVKDGLVRVARFVEAHPARRGATRSSSGESVERALSWQREKSLFLRKTRRFGDLQALTAWMKRRLDACAGQGVQARRNVWHQNADVFVAWRMAKTYEENFVTKDPLKRHSFFNNILTAYYTTVLEHTTAKEIAKALQEAESLCWYMSLVAIGDTKIFDKDYFPFDSSESNRFKRLRVSATLLSLFLQVESPVSDGMGNHTITSDQGRFIVEKIARNWIPFLAPFRRTCLRRVLELWVNGMKTFYEASVYEYDPNVLDSPLLKCFESPDSDEEKKYAIQGMRAKAAGLSPGLAARLEDLFCSNPSSSSWKEDLDEIRLIVFSKQVSPTIGSSQYFRTWLLHQNASELTEERLLLFEAAMRPIDMLIRILNDCSDIFRFKEGDRDVQKKNSCTILMRKTSGPEALVAEKMRVRLVCERVLELLEKDSKLALDNISAVWPAAGDFMERSVTMGAEIYKLSHYETTSKEEMRALAEDISSGKISFFSS